jgi:TM2 domain-containing membrane protein YozV
MSVPYQPVKPQKSYIVALLLSIFLGTFGIDRFYLGHVGLGVAKLLLSWATFGIWQIIDLILVAMRKVDTSNFVWDDQVGYAQPVYYQDPNQPQNPYQGNPYNN